MCLVPVWYLIIMGVSIRLAEGINCTDPDWNFYSGTVAVTDGGRTCQLWTEHTPHQHWLDEGYRFPNDNNSTENAVNYCRIPNEGDFPWCYTTDPHRRYQDCNNRICGGPICGGVQTNVTGTFSSLDWDGDGNYDNKKDCLWTIIAPEDKRIEVEILSMAIEYHYACSYDFLEIYEQDFSHGRFCGLGPPPPPVKSLGNILYVLFYADQTENDLGFRANFTHIQRENDGTHGTNGSDPIPDMYVGQVLCPPGTDLRLYSGNVSTTNGGRTCQPWAETTPFWHNLMGSHNYPIDGSVEAANNYCRNIHSSHIPWCFTMDIERPFQYCDERICDVGDPKCGGIVTASYGSLTAIDRNQDGKYDMQQDCLWTLIAPPGMQIEVQVHSVDIPFHPLCYIDALSIYEDNFQDGLVCGELSSYTYRSRSNVTLIRFVTNTADQWPGFNLTFSHVERMETTIPTTQMTSGQSAEVTSTVQSSQSSQPSTLVPTTETQTSSQTRQNDMVSSGSSTDGSAPHYEGTTESGCTRQNLNYVLISLSVIFCECIWY